MGFGGSAAAMIQSIRANASQLAKRKGYFEKEVTNKTVYGAFVDHKKMSPTDFQAFREKLKREERLRIKKLLLVFSIIMSLIIRIVCYFLF